MTYYAMTMENVRKEYPSSVVLDNISFSVKQHALHGLLGPNGAGKTTTLKILAGRSQSSGGNVFIHGKEIKEYQSLKNLPVAFLSDHPPLYPLMKVKKFLSFCGSLQGLDRDENQELIFELTKNLKLQNFLEKTISILSRGQKQKVALAGMMMGRPRVLLLDEPFVGLDPRALVEFRDHLHYLCEQTTILLSSHQLHDVSLLCETVTIMDHGRTVLTEDVKQLTKSGEDDLENIFLHTTQTSEEVSCF